MPPVWAGLSRWTKPWMTPCWHCSRTANRYDRNRAIPCACLIPAGRQYQCQMADADQSLRNPLQFRDETSKYTDTLPDRSSLQFTFPMDVKSLITSPSGQMHVTQGSISSGDRHCLVGRGQHQTCRGRADGGQTWGDALIESQQLDKALVRFSIPWRWDGAPAVLQSRATDSAGNVQPTRDAVLQQRARLIAITIPVYRAGE